MEVQRTCPNHGPLVRCETTYKCAECDYEEPKLEPLYTHRIFAGLRHRELEPQQYCEKHWFDGQGLADFNADRNAKKLAITYHVDATQYCHDCMEEAASQPKLTV